MGGISLRSFLGHTALRRFASDDFIVLDIGTFSVKTLYVTKSNEQYKILSHSLRKYTGSDITSEGHINSDGILHACQLSLKDLKKAVGARRGFSKKVILGIGGGFVHGMTMSHNYIRERPKEEIDVAELANIIQRVQQRAYEQVRRYFRKETARSELDVRIVSAAVQEIKLDGYQVVSPLGFSGKEIGVGLFNAYIPKVHLAIFEDIVAALKLDIISFVSQPYAVFKFLLKQDPSLGDFILIDIGGSITEIALARKGRLEDVKSIPIGGSSFTKSIRENLKMELREAENIKAQFAGGSVSKRAEKKLVDIISSNIELFTRGLEEVLIEFSQLALLPPRIYVYGGGASIGIMAKFLRREKWRSALSFSARPTIEVMNDVLWVVPNAMAYTYAAGGEYQGEIAKALRRSLRLIQG